MGSRESGIPVVLRNCGVKYLRHRENNTKIIRRDPSFNNQTQKGVCQDGGLGVGGREWLARERGDTARGG